MWELTRNANSQTPPQMPCISIARVVADDVFAQAVQVMQILAGLLSPGLRKRIRSGASDPV